jgi:hypothetical protein
MSSMLLAAAAAAAVTTAPAAPPEPAVTAQQAIDNARALTSAAPPKREECAEATGDQIVVCARHEDPRTQYVPSSTDNGDTYDGVPHAPNVSGLPDCAAATVCAQHLGKQPRQLYIIDLKAIPEPPAGSDADKIARGEMAAP